MKPAYRALLGVAALAHAACGMGAQIGAGPVVGYVGGRGVSLGWEAGGGPIKTETRNSANLVFPSLVTHVNAGMSWRPSARELVSYAAWEPWFLVGGSLGAAYNSTDRRAHLLAGVWEAAPWFVGHASSEGWNRPPACSPCYTVSIALGWRWAAGSEVYLAPKLSILQGIDKPWPYWTYAD